MVMNMVKKVYIWQEQMFLVLFWVLLWKNLKHTKVQKSVKQTPYNYHPDYPVLSGEKKSMALNFSEVWKEAAPQLGECAQPPVPHRPRFPFLAVPERASLR